MTESNDRPARAKAVDDGWAMRAAAYYLERYASSADNLRRVLERKALRRSGLDRLSDEMTETIGKAVARMIDLGLIDDRQYAEMRTASLRRRGASKVRIAADLQSKGIEREMIGAAIADDPVAEIAAARRLAERRRIGPWRTHALPDDASEARRERQREMAILCRNGFSPDLARRIIDGGILDWE